MLYDVGRVSYYQSYLTNLFPVQLSFVKEIHDFHMWALSDGKVMFTAHLVVTGNPSYALYNVTELLQKEFGIYHSTIQMEPAKKSHFTSGKPGLLPCVNEFNFD